MGEVVSFEVGEVEDGAMFGDLGGEVMGLLSAEDIDLVGEFLEPGNTAALIVWENTWARKLIGAIENAGGQLWFMTAQMPRPSTRHWRWRSEETEMLVRRGIGRIGRSSLIGTAARTAVVGGTATAVVGGMPRHQAEKAQRAEATAYDQRQQQEAMAAASHSAAPVAAGLPNPVTQLQETGRPKGAGFLTDEEFAAQKASILAQ